MTRAIIDHTHDPALASWVASAGDHGDFPIQNLPFGIIRPPHAPPRAAVAIGDAALDLPAAADAGLLPGEVAAALREPTLNALLGLPGDHRRQLRARLSELLSDERHRDAVEPLLWDRADCAALLPSAIGDYTDFYVGIHHATNVGRLFRPDAPLLPNYKHVPIGYHGRASSVRPSGGDVLRPNGQHKAPDAASPSFGPSSRLDYELELGIWIGEGNALGQPIRIADAWSHIAGFSLFNDWSARDVQAWEYQPLGPFLAKSFHTTVSPWIVTAEALAPFRMGQPERPPGDPEPMPYLFDAEDQRTGALSISLEVFLSSQRMRAAGIAPMRLSVGHATSAYWTVAQLVAHHSSNGCNLNPGDLLGTGTLSGAERSGFGSLLELTDGGSAPIELPGGETRRFLDDGDEIRLAARAEAPGARSIGFSDCRATIRPAVIP